MIKYKYIILQKKGGENMEEKNAAKISLSTLFLILAIIAIIVMGIFIYKLNNDKIVEIKKSTELQAQVNNLNATVSDLQGKIDNISKTINSNNVEQNQVNANNVEKNEVSSSNQAKVQSYSTIKGVYENNGYQLILVDDGTFLYDFPNDSPIGVLGNYTISQDEILLKYLYRHGGDYSKTVTQGQKTLKINADNSITDSKPEEANKSITLKKTSSNISQEDIDYIKDLLNNAPEN